MASICVILNPVAGRGYAGRILPLVRQCFTELGADFEIVPTRMAGEAVDLASRAVADGCSTVVAVGGDGTAHEVINGMMAASEGVPSAVLGCIPAGSGNDFSVPSGAPTDVRKACEQIVRGKTRLIDVGHMVVDDQYRRYFDNAVGIGFDAWVTVGARRFRYVRGMALYIPVVLQTIVRTMQPMRATITVDGETTERQIVMAVACNGPREGGSFRIAPQAQFDDRELDLCVVDWMSRASMLRMVFRFMDGSHVHDPRVTARRGSDITILSDDPLVLHVDGEMPCAPAHSVKVRTVPQALRLISPA